MVWYVTYVSNNPNDGDNIVLQLYDTEEQAIKEYTQIEQNHEYPISNKRMGSSYPKDYKKR